MKDLLEKAVVFVAEIEAKIIELSGLIDKNKLLLDKNQKGEIAIERKSKELASREGKIKHIEDVAAIEASNIERDKDIKKGEIELNTQRNAFVTYHEQVKEENQAIRTSLDLKIKAADYKEAEYVKALKDLKEEKKKVKANVLKELSANLG